MEEPLQNRSIYLDRMSKPLKEKLRVTNYIDTDAEYILDVGCADGTVTLAMAELFPDKKFLGIDLDGDFIEQAKSGARERGLLNVRFEKIYLRELLDRDERFDTVTFISVLHEFFSYGEGISSVLKALADAEELLKPGGDIVIRDMVLREYTKNTTYLAPVLLDKIRANHDIALRMDDVAQHFGPINTIYAINHFLLKYFYTENWPRESREHYVPVTIEQYQQIFALLGMEVILEDQQLLTFLKEAWITDFGFNDIELDPLKSTGFLVARKPL
jgi:2-polyprenyl-3-methyl-5-hydroxy-6-metoxy-1,4-benzoquinol methylase